MGGKRALVSEAAFTLGGFFVFFTTTHTHFTFYVILWEVTYKLVEYSLLKKVKLFTKE